MKQIFIYRKSMKRIKSRCMNICLVVSKYLCKIQDNEKYIGLFDKKVKMKYTIIAHNVNCPIETYYSKYL